MKLLYLMLLCCECAIFAGKCTSCIQEEPEPIVVSDAPKKMVQNPSRIKTIVIGAKGNEPGVPAEFGAESRRLSEELGNLQPGDVIVITPQDQ